MRRLGKRAFFTRLVDAAEIKGKTGKIAKSASSQPSDYILTLDGLTSYAEVKSTGHKTSFAFSLLRPDQVGAAKQVTAAGGSYLIFVHSLVLDRWFCIPWSVIQLAKDEGRGSLAWDELAPLEWKH